MRFLVRGLDALVRRCAGVYEFTDDPDCILRLQRTRAPDILQFPGGEVVRGEPALGLHLWNERLPPMPAAGPDLAWALHLQRRFVRSLGAVAREMQRDPSLAGVRAVGARTGALLPGEASSGVQVMERLGFTVTPYHTRLGTFGDFWENLYSYWLIWAFTPASLRFHRFSGMGRMQTWMLASDFLARYGGGGGKG